MDYSKMTKVELSMLIGNYTAKYNNFDIEGEAQKIIKEWYGKSMQEILKEARRVAKERRDILKARADKIKKDYYDKLK